MKKTTIRMLLLGALGLTGCASGANVARTRFANEFDCPEKEVAVKELGGKSYKTTGCGQAATYTTSCSGFGCMGPIIVRND